MTVNPRLSLLALCALALGLLTPAALHADSCTAPGNLVQNCSFSTGSFTDWSLSRAGSGTDILIDNDGYSGDNAANFGAYGNEYDTIAQTLGTTAGQEYTLTFWLTDAGGEGPDSDTDFQALWDGTSILDQYTTTNGNVEFTFTVDGTGSDTLSFEGYNATSWYYLSDVSVTPGVSSVTPEPSSFLLLGTGLLGFAFLPRRRYQRSA